MKNRLFGSLILAALGMPGSALAADAAAEYAITGNAGFTSDYVFNGISQNFRSPAIQGGFDYVHASGAYLGTWASSVSGNQYTNASLEWDIYAGYNGKVNEDLAYGVGMIWVFYPGGKTNPAGPTKKWDTTELTLGCTWKALNVKYAYTLTDWYGISSAIGGGFEPAMWLPGDTTAASGASVADDPAANSSSRGSGYVEANYAYELGDGFTMAAHAGHQKVKSFSKLNYTDYRLAINKTFAGFNLGLSFTTTNATDNNLYHVAANGDNKKLGESIFAVSAGRSF